MLSFKSLPKFTLKLPTTLEEALELKNSYKSDAVLLSGGSDLMVELRHHLKKPKVVIDLKKIKELQKVTYNSKEGLIIGATVSYKTLQDIPDIKKEYSVFFDAMEHLCDALIRNRAGPVGNICTASPAGDSAPALMVYDAKVKIQKKNGERIVLLRDFFAGVKKTILEDNEIVTQIIIPPSQNIPGKYYKAMRNSEDIAVTGVAVFFGKLNNKYILRVGLSSVAPTPQFFNLDFTLEKKGSLNEKIDQAIKQIQDSIKPISDVRGSEDYKRHIAEVYVRKALYTLVGGK